jgi:hypothetical protein
MLALLRILLVNHVITELSGASRKTNRLPRQISNAG